jgi:hypothetical protein
VLGVADEEIVHYQGESSGMGVVAEEQQPPLPRLITLSTLGSKNEDAPGKRTRSLGTVANEPAQKKPPMVVVVSEKPCWVRRETRRSWDKRPDWGRPGTVLRTSQKRKGCRGSDGGKKGDQVLLGWGGKWKTHQCGQTQEREEWHQGNSNRQCRWWP